MSMRELQQVIAASRTSDGAGVSLYRSIGRHGSLRADPFLMLDEFGSDRPDEYIGGFPSHPHRGFETVTYMLDGHLLHEDHLGNRGHLRAGDVQWMTAGSGIIHSEMPQQQNGLMRGFQLWLNLPAATKLQAPAWRDIPAAELVRAEVGAGVHMTLIAGELTTAAGAWRGPVQRPHTEPLLADLRLQPGAAAELAIPAEWQVVLYVFAGALQVGADRRPLQQREAGILGAGARVQMVAGSAGASVLLLAGRPLREPVAQWGPFVMNTRAEIEQALEDYRNGRLVDGRPEM